MKKRVGILISGRGSNMRALVEAARAADGLVMGMVRLEDGPAALVDAAALCRSVLATA